MTVTNVPAVAEAVRELDSDITFVIEGMMSRTRSSSSQNSNATQTLLTTVLNEWMKYVSMALIAYLLLIS